MFIDFKVNTIPDKYRSKNDTYSYQDKSLRIDKCNIYLHWYDNINTRYRKINLYELENTGTIWEKVERKNVEETILNRVIKLKKELTLCNNCGSNFYDYTHMNVAIETMTSKGFFFEDRIAVCVSYNTILSNNLPYGEGCNKCLVDRSAGFY